MGTVPMLQNAWQGGRNLQELSLALSCLVLVLLSFLPKATNTWIQDGRCVFLYMISNSEANVLKTYHFYFQIPKPQMSLQYCIILCMWVFRLLSDEHICTQISFVWCPFQNCLLAKSLHCFLAVNRRVMYETQRISYLHLNILFLTHELYGLNLEAKNFESLCFLVLWVPVREWCWMRGTTKMNTDCFSSLHCMSCAGARIRD